jgi:uncharacterized membrane protein
VASVIGSTSYEEIMQDVVRGFEVAGVGVLVVGSVLAFARFAVELFRRPLDQAYEGVRHRVGRAILLGLEVLIIADIVRTIIVDPTLESVGVLGLIVVIRIVLSFSLEIEMEGTVPWHAKRAAADPPA